MNIIALLAAFGFLCFYALTAALLIPLPIAVWVLKQVIGAIKWLQEAV
ncbi:MAG TPA: hypothetical protein VJQ82_09915 [Terriglobales bacterium]|nr:hypothetical protein [Terriglobales bacterium]